MTHRCLWLIIFSKLHKSERPLVELSVIFVGYAADFFGCSEIKGWALLVVFFLFFLFIERVLYLVFLTTS